MVCLKNFREKMSRVTFHQARSSSKYLEDYLSYQAQNRRTQNRMNQIFPIFVKFIILKTKEKACFKNPQNPTCIDLILANRPRSFQDSTVLEAGLPDFHKMCVTVMKMYHCRQKPSVITYRKLKIFSNIEFTKDLEEHFTKFEHFGNIPFNLSKETVNIILEKLRNLLRKNM